MSSGARGLLPVVDIPSSHPESPLPATRRHTPRILASQPISFPFWTLNWLEKSPASFYLRSSSPDRVVKTVELCGSDSADGGDAPGMRCMARFVDRTEFLIVRVRGG